MLGIVIGLVIFIVVSAVIGQMVDGGPVSPYKYRAPLEPFFTGVLLVMGGLVLVFVVVMGCLMIRG